MEKIELNKIYFLDVGSLAPIEIKTKEFTKYGVMCKYLNSYGNRFDVINYDIFEMNGIIK